MVSSGIMDPPIPRKQPIDQFKNLKFLSISMPKLFLIFLRDNLQFSFAGVGSCDLNNKDEIIVKKENPDKTSL